MLYIMTLVETKARLGIVDPIDDAALTSAIEFLQGRFESELSRDLLRAERTNYFDGGETQLLLSAFPVETVSAVYVDSTRTFGTETLLDPASYALYRLRGVLKFGAGTPWADGIQNIKVIFTGGFVAAGAVAEAGQYELDQSLRGAFAMQFDFEWRNRNQLGSNSVSAQGTSINLAPAKFLPEVQRVLELQKRI